MRRIFLLVALVMGMVSSCSDEEVTLDPEKLGKQYYPLEVGSYRIYHVTQTQYNDNVAQTGEFDLREEIDAIIKDQTGRDWYRVEVSTRPAEEANWTVTGVQMLSVSDTDLRVQEENKTLVHMVFPVENGKSWVANAFVEQMAPFYYRYEKAGETFEVDGTTYANTVTLNQGYAEDLLRLYEKYEVLAHGVGPVYRSFKNFSYCDRSEPGGPCTVGTGYIVTGSERFEELIETGKE